MEPAKWEQYQDTRVVQVSACTTTIVIMAFDKKLVKIAAWNVCIADNNHLVENYVMQFTTNYLNLFLAMYIYVATFGAFSVTHYYTKLKKPAACI